MATNIHESITISGKEYAIDTLYDSIEGTLYYVAGWNRHNPSGNPLEAEYQPAFRSLADLNRWAEVMGLSDEEFERFNPPPFAHEKKRISASPRTAINS